MKKYKDFLLLESYDDILPIGTEVICKNVKQDNINIGGWIGFISRYSEMGSGRLNGISMKGPMYLLNIRYEFDSRGVRTPDDYWVFKECVMPINSEECDNYLKKLKEIKDKMKDIDPYGEEDWLSENVQNVVQDITDQDYNNIINHYKKPVYSRSNLDNQKLGWRTRYGQYKRFDYLLNIGFKEGDSILDYGCGLGNLYDYMLNKYNNFTYTGMDINMDFIEQAKRKYGDNLFYKINKKNDIRGNFDWVVASGVFTVHTSDNMLYNTIDFLYNICNKGISFNFLTGNNFDVQKTPDSKSVSVRGYDKDKLLNYFISKYNNVDMIPVKINDGILIDEYNIYIYKNNN